jgi:hypothetical protein
MQRCASLLPSSHSAASSHCTIHYLHPISSCFAKRMSKARTSCCRFVLPQAVQTSCVGLAQVHTCTVLQKPQPTKSDWAAISDAGGSMCRTVLFHNVHRRLACSHCKRRNSQFLPWKRFQKLEVLQAVICNRCLCCLGCMLTCVHSNHCCVRGDGTCHASRSLHHVTANIRKARVDSRTAAEAAVMCIHELLHFLQHTGPAAVPQ